MSASDRLRRVIIRPYLPGRGPVMTLDMYDSGIYDPYRTVIRYRLHVRQGARSVVLFSGEDYRPSPMHSVDGDDSVGGLLGFLTLRPGDTDADYFANYTADQLAWANDHGEATMCEWNDRTGNNIE